MSRAASRPNLARTVAEQLTAAGALTAHARDELGLSAELAARPLQAAVASAGTFAVGAGVPLVAAVFAPDSALVVIVGAVSLACLVGLGALAAAAGGASPWRGAARVGFWGLVAMGVTAAVGRLFGTAV